MIKVATIDEYIAGFSLATQQLLAQVRTAIKNAVPGAEEKISYGIPTFTLKDHYVIYFAGYKNHIAVYPAPRNHEKFKKELAAYKGGVGTVQFPISKPLPLKLIVRIARFRAKESLEKEKTKLAKKTAKH